MLTFTNEFTCTNYYDFPQFDSEDILYFDIETTGFSADVSSLYLIGCCYKKDHQFHFIQWFADTYDSEPDLLHSFFQLMEHFSALVHFNGDTFDIPYLEKKCAQYSLPYSFSSIQSIDIYKLISPYRKKLSFDNLKLKTIEKFLSIERNDNMDGKKLIKLYGTYMQERFKNKNPDKIEELQYLLLLHNQEDVQNLPAVSAILFYTDLFQSLPEIVNAGFYTKDKTSEISYKDILSNRQIPDCYAITFSIPLLFSSMLKIRENFCYPIQNCNKNVVLQLSEEQVILTLPVINDVLRYYYPNYKDYYYLPKEDKAIHKSVGIYVEKEYRKKATADTAYLSQKGLYLPQPTHVFTPAFQYERKEEISFFQLTEMTDVQSETFQLFLLQWWRKFFKDII